MKLERANHGGIGHRSDGLKIECGEGLKHSDVL
uniref:Uncharacterized protein n=1 Tax=Arundo donax TaxID=35708 RepID=A0A0A9A4Z6_ARUDO